MKKGYLKKPAEQGKIAAERIEELVMLAVDSRAAEPDLSRRYIGLARKIAMKYRLRIAARLRRMYCDKCNTVFLQGACRVRLTEGKVTYFCEYCRAFTRLPFLKEQRERRMKRASAR